MGSVPWDTSTRPKPGGSGDSSPACAHPAPEHSHPGCQTHGEPPGTCSDTQSLLQCDSVLGGARTAPAWAEAISTPLLSTGTGCPGWPPHLRRPGPPLTLPSSQMRSGAPRARHRVVSPSTAPQPGHGCGSSGCSGSAEPREGALGFSPPPPGALARAVAGVCLSRQSAGRCPPLVNHSGIRSRLPVPSRPHTQPTAPRVAPVPLFPAGLWPSAASLPARWTDVQAEGVPGVTGMLSRAGFVCFPMKACRGRAVGTGLSCGGHLHPQPGPWPLSAQQAWQTQQARLETEAESTQAAALVPAKATLAPTAW